MQPMPAAPHDVEDDLRTEVLSLCRSLIRVDTTNPPGRETAAAVLTAPGVVEVHSRNIAYGCYMFAVTPLR